jgi:hypothetical protein
VRLGLLVIALFALACLATCSGTATNSCICSVVAGTESANLECGQSGCVGGTVYLCDVDGPTAYGSCGSDGGTDLLFPYSPCDPSTSTCEAITFDGGVRIEPTCDPITRRCCVPTGNFCTTSFDCCEGHTCVDTLASEEGDGGYAAPRHCGN